MVSFSADLCCTLQFDTVDAAAPACTEGDVAAAVDRAATKGNGERTAATQQVEGEEAEKEQKEEEQEEEQEQEEEGQEVTENNSTGTSARPAAAMSDPFGFEDQVAAEGSAMRTRGMGARRMGTRHSTRRSNSSKRNQQNKKQSRQQLAEEQHEGEEELGDSGTTPANGKQKESQPQQIRTRSNRSKKTLQQQQQQQHKQQHKQQQQGRMQEKTKSRSGKQSATATMKTRADTKETPASKRAKRSDDAHFGKEHSRSSRQLRFSKDTATTAAAAAEGGGDDKRVLRATTQAATEFDAYEFCESQDEPALPSIKVHRMRREKERGREVERSRERETHTHTHVHTHVPLRCASSKR